MQCVESHTARMFRERESFNETFLKKHRNSTKEENIPRTDYKHQYTQRNINFWRKQSKCGGMGSDESNDNILVKTE